MVSVVRIGIRFINGGFRNKGWNREVVSDAPANSVPKPVP